ncbi:MAG: hypothetical protein AAF270_14900, partial [Pseudomonadota bacterium]
AAASLSFVFGFIGLMEWLIRTPSQVLRWAIEVSYFTYIAHLLIVYEASIWMVTQGWDQHVAVPAAAAFGLIVCVALYVIFVRYTPLNWLLAGYKKSWFGQPFRRNGWGYRAPEGE